MATYSKVGQEEFDKILSGGYISNAKIAGMSYTQLAQLVSSGRVSVKELRSTYSQLRTTAKSRERTISGENAVEQFGSPDRQNFRVSKNLVTTSELLHELAEVGKFLRGNKSTITGLKKERSYLMEKFGEAGFEVDESNYKEFKKFMKWFHASEFAKKWDSDQPEVSEVFNNGKASPADWRRLFKELEGRTPESAPVRQY